MTAAATTEPTNQTTEPANAGQPSRSAHLIGLVRKLIDYAKDLATTFRQHAATSNTGFVARARNFGTADIALIIARITNGLLRARALEARLLRNASNFDAKPSREPRTPSPRAPRATPAAEPTTQHPALENLPTADRIAAEVRRRPIGAVIADICRDLGILPSHPLWEELTLVVMQYGGSLGTLLKDILQRLFPVDLVAIRARLAASRAPSRAPASTGPP